MFKIIRLLLMAQILVAADPEKRREIARRGAHARWSRVTDRAEATRPAREAFMQQFEAPASVTDPRQRESMRSHAIALAMARLRDFQAAK
jgi:hypothetical protein